jgi:nucleotide-binding universal stress UspA family protein
LWALAPRQGAIVDSAPPPCTHNRNQALDSTRAPPEFLVTFGDEAEAPMKKMLVALDGSPRERDVLAAATALGRKTGAKVILFRAVGVPQELPSEAYSMAPEEIPALLERRATLELKELEKSVPTENRGGVRVIVGTPYRSIESAAEMEDVDLIVIGSHGYHSLDRILGTTAAKVVNHSDRSVLVVRAHERLV